MINNEWLHVSNEEEPKLFNSGRLQHLVHSLKSPSQQKPSFIFLIGSTCKNAALREIFPNNVFKKGHSNAMINLQLDNSSSLSENPIFFCEQNKFAKPGIQERGSETLFWASSFAYSQTQSIILRRLLFLFVDTICIFADDFSSLDEVNDLLQSWVIAGDPSTPTHFIRPRVVIVQKGFEATPSVTYDLLQLEDAQTGLHYQNLRNHFSSMKVLYLATEQISPLSRFRRLKELLWREMDETRWTRFRSHHLFSALHTAALFDKAYSSVARSITDSFDFISASRLYNRSPPAMTPHLKEMIVRYKSSWKSLVRYIASCILLDFYTPGMHHFDPSLVFATCYRQQCSLALRETLREEDMIKAAEGEIEDEIDALYNEMTTSGVSTATYHQTVIQSMDVDWEPLKLTRSCLYCLARWAHGPLSCNHTICEICIRTFGRPTFELNDQYAIDNCLYCKSGKLIVGVRPVTSGLRLLSLDGGGIRGKISIEILQMLQKPLGSLWRFQDLIDVVFGTSVGGLLALILFSRQMSIPKCASIFNLLARQLFPPSSQRKSFFFKFYRFIQSVRRDGIYEESVLESCLKQRLGEDSLLFGHIPAVTATNIGVTTATINKGDPIIVTNYNGLTGVDHSYGYWHAKPSKLEDEIRTWQAYVSTHSQMTESHERSGRMTSAAPSLFPHFYHPATGPVQDGGMSKHNNPIKLAIWEMQSINPSNPKPDITISIGTGYKKAPQNSLFRHNGFDNYLMRVCRNYMSMFDGEPQFLDVVNVLAIEERKTYKRLNVHLPQNEPGMDDTSRLEELKELVWSDLNIKNIATETIRDLLATSFFFELVEIPQKTSGGGFVCTGVILCRIPGTIIHKLLQRVGLMPFRFVTENQRLGSYDKDRDLCPSCYQFRRKIELSVNNLVQSVTIYLETDQGYKRALSAFPKTIDWFVQTLGLEAPFGSDGHFDRARKYCKRPEGIQEAGSCQQNRKRKVASDYQESPKKRRRCGSSGHVPRSLHSPRTS